MEPNCQNSMLLYPKQQQESFNHYVQRQSLQNFKKIDKKRIKDEFETLESAKVRNRKQTIHWLQLNKDRYHNIFPYEHNRVVCNQIKDFYINASFMKSINDNNIYAIFAQAPVRSAVFDFWYALYHFEVKSVFMLCAFEDKIRGRQAEKYWPSVNQQLKLSHLKLIIKCKSVEKIQSDFVRTVLIMEGQEGLKEIEHIHWTGWGDMKIPQGEKSHKMFRKLVEDCVQRIQKQELIAVHCSAGVGRSGTLGAAIEALRCLRNNESVSIFEVVNNLRENRLFSVESLQQYAYIYEQLSKMI